MTIKFKRIKADTEQEQNILIQCITNTEFLNEVHRVMRKEYLLTDYSKTLWNWISEYYKAYNEAPKKLIVDIYNVNKDKIDEGEAKLIDSMLQGLNKKFVENENLNVKYSFDKALLYIKKRALEEHISQIKSNIDLGNIEEAERIQSQFNKVMQVTSGWKSPLDEDFIKEVRKKKDDDVLFSFNGALNELVGPLRRGWCICALGVYSFGKSWLLGEIRNLALFSKLKVAEISLEMTEFDSTDRFYRRILSRSEKAGNYLIPVFDCYHNMTGTCTKKFRKNKERLFDPKHEEKPIPNIESFKPEFTDGVDLGPKGYKCCDYCRKKKDLRSDYKKEVWYERQYREEITERDIIKKAKAIKRMYNNNYKLICYPKFSANVQDIRRDLDILEYTEDFIPDVIIVDYPGILAVEDRRVTSEEQHLNDTWVALCQLAGTLNCLVVGAAQVKTDAIKKKSLSLGDNSQSVRSISANCNLILGLFGTDEEKKLGLARLNVIKHRHDEFNESDEIVILRQLELGQSILDSEWDDD